MTTWRGSSSIQDIGWQIAFRWRGECHLLCISPAPALLEQHSTFIARTDQKERTNYCVTTHMDVL